MANHSPKVPHSIGKTQKVTIGMITPRIDISNVELRLFATLWKYPIADTLNPFITNPSAKNGKPSDA